MVISDASRIFDIYPAIVPGCSLVDRGPTSFAYRGVGSPRPITGAGDSNLAAAPTTTTVNTAVLRTITVTAMTRPITEHVETTADRPGGGNREFTFGTMRAVSLRVPLSLGVPPGPPPTPAVDGVPTVRTERPPRGFSVYSQLGPYVIPGMVGLAGATVDGTVSRMPVGHGGSFKGIFNTGGASTRLPADVGTANDVVMGGMVPGLNGSHILLTSTSAGYFTGKLFSNGLACLLVRGTCGKPTAATIKAPAGGLCVVILPVST